MRLIDADEYEKRIKPYDTEDDMDKALYNFAHYHLVTTPSAQAEQAWIPVSERLPEVYENAFHETWSDLVLVTVDDGIQIRYTTDACLIDGVWQWNIEDDYWKKVDGEVIAWMPLPEPYKGDTDGQP